MEREEKIQEGDRGRWRGEEREKWKEEKKGGGKGELIWRVRGDGEQRERKAGG